MHGSRRSFPPRPRPPARSRLSHDSSPNPSSLPSPTAAAAASSPNSDQTLLLDVQVNGHPIGKIGEFILRRGQLMARPQELRDLGFRLPNSRSSQLAGLIALSDLPGLTWSLDQQNQVLRIAIGNAGLLPAVLLPLGRDQLEERRVIESGTGATLNYDIVNTLADRQTGATGSLDLRAFSPWGVASSGWLACAGAHSAGCAANRAIRLDSAYSWADVNTLRRYSLGDFITGALAWTRPVHLEGAQIRSDFSMRPDLVTFPMPSFAASAAVPSTIDVLVDGNRVASGPVDAGPFETPQLPVMSGAGTISMTVTNALGQQITMTQPFYAAPSLLAPGLQTFSAEAGLVRRNWGSASSDYGKPAGQATWRRGLNNKFTVEGTAQATPGALLAGAGGVAQIGSLGVLNFAAAVSSGSTSPGTQISAGAQRIGRMFSLGASASLASRGFRDIAAVNGDGTLRKQLSAFTSLSFRRFGSVGVAYAALSQDAPPLPSTNGSLPAQHSQIVSASYSVQFRRMSIDASEFKNYAGTSDSSGLQIGFTIPIGRRSSVNVGATSSGTAQLQTQKSAAEIGDWGYQAYISAGSSTHEFAEAQYKSPIGLFTAGIDNSSGRTTLRMESQAALSFADRRLFPSNTIYDSFGIVDTSPLPHVHVFQENIDVGTTNASGRLLVPDLRSFDLNHIAIAATDIPADASLANPSRAIRPQDRSGVIVKFPIRFSRGALLRLVDQAGVPLPLGSTATLRATGALVPVGYDGQAYVENLAPHNQLTVDRPDGSRCTLAFDYRPIPGDIPSIGPLRCVEPGP